MKGKPQVVFVCQVFYPDSTPTSQVFSRLFQKLADRGLEVTVLCGYPGRMERLEMNLPRNESIGGIHILRCGWNISFKRSYFHRFFSYFSFLTHVGWKLIWSGRKGVVLGVTNPPFLSIILFLTSCLGRFQYQYIFHDLYPEGLVALNKLRGDSILVKFWTFLNRISYQRASVLSVLGRDMIPLLQKNYAIANEKFIHIPNWSTVDISSPREFSKNSLARELGIENKVVVQYSGNMGLWHDLETFVRAAAILRDQDSIQFLFIGGGIRRESAVKLSQQLNLNNIIWRDFVPKEQLAESLSCAHISLISLKKGLEGIAVPSKLYGILASGRPLIAQVPNDSEIALVIEEEGCGFVVEPEQSDPLAVAIRTLAENKDLRVNMGNRAFDAYQKKYTVERAARTFEELWGIQKSEIQ
ncbi:MAG: glycosyltransferase family 4 protein [SAR324 cluster bacterium]|nr:glycosyltransferase family 4 protein [SAR324 cluster bacterium]